MNKKSLFIIPLSVLMLVGCNGKSSGGATTSQEPTFTVVWKNYDGTVLETDTGLKKGETPTYDSATPTRAASAQYTFTFEGWTPEVVAVTADAEYTATYSETVNQYTVNWVIEGETVKTQTVDYGTTVSWTEADPSKASTAEYDYTFTGWDYDLANPITGNTTITAEFSSQKRSYTITFLNDNGAEIEHHSVEYGEMPVCETLPEKEGTVTYNYDFAGWDNEIAAVTGAATYTATYTAIPLDFTLIENAEGNYYRCNGLKNNVYTGEVNIPSTYKGLPVKTIYEYGFAGCTGITNVNIPSSVTDIGNYTFRSSSVRSVSIPGSVKSIGESVFSGCAKLENIELHEGTEVIGSYAFANTAIRELKLVDSLKTISANAFRECHLLTRIETATGDSFKDCTISTNSFYLSSNITELVNNTASISNSDAKAKFPYPTGNYIIRVTDSANKGTFEYEEVAESEGELKRIFYTYPGSSETYLVGAYGNGDTLRTGKATMVKAYAFSADDRINNLYVGSSIKDNGLGGSCFGGMVNLNSVSFEGDGYLAISSYCFRDCVNLSSVDWGVRKIHTIGALGFAGCSSLVFTLPTSSSELILYDECFSGTANTSLEISKNLKAVDCNPFCNIPGLATLTVNSENAYFKAVDNVLFTIDGKTLVAYASNKVETSYTIPEGVEVIGKYAMTRVNNLETVTLPQSLKTLSSPCLNGNSDKLTAINYAGTVEEFKLVNGINGWWKDTTITVITCSDGTWPQ